jgi:glutaconate CoA-transferase subunit A
MMWGITGVQKEAVLAAKRVIVTVEEIVDSFELKANAVTLPGWVIDAVCVEPGGAYPSYALGYSERDNGFYKSWDAISREREGFKAWMQRHVLGTKNFSEYTRSVASEQVKEAAGA